MTLLSFARNHIGVRERVGDADHPLIVFWLSLCKGGNNLHDETPWCSAAMNGLCWHLGLPRSFSLAARSWLAIGTPIPLEKAVPGWDIAILSRGDGPQPGPNVLDAPGHVAVIDHLDPQRVWLIGGNQGDEFRIAPFPSARVIGVRRILPPGVVA